MSAKLSLFALALLCMCVFAQAQVKTSITVTTYNNGNCATGTEVATQVYNSTTCYTYGDGLFIKYTANADGSFVYSSLFSESTCTTYYSYTVSEYVAGASTCFLSLNSMTSARYVVANPSVGPASTFPPTDFVVGTTCFNATTHTNTETTPCAAASGLFCYRVATKQCQPFKVWDSSNVIGSKWYQANSDSTITQAVFTSTDCTGTVVRAQITPNQCRQGSVYAAGTVKSLTLPTQGSIEYKNNACDAAGIEVVSLFAPTTCFQVVNGGAAVNTKFGCSVINGTSTATYTTYTDSTNMGLCTIQTSQIFRNTESCYQRTLSSSTKYVCNYNPSMNGASSVSVSVVAMLAAAVVALFAGRQL